MNQTQLRYVRQRAEALKAAHLQTLRERHTTPATVLTLEEKIEEIKAGRFDLRSNVNSYAINALDARLIFTQERPAVVDQTSFKADEARVNAQYTKLMDELILGDDETALNLLKEFAELV